MKRYSVFSGAIVAHLFYGQQHLFRAVMFDFDTYECLWKEYSSYGSIFRRL